MKTEILLGDNIEVLKTLDSEIFNCCITSPPYFGLRDYGTGVWVGGDTSCSHRRDSKKSLKTITGHKNFDEMGGVGDAIYKTVCPKCGAVREDKQVGLEETPEEYTERLVNIFREVKRVLKKDGTLWLNLGDSYSGSGKGANRDRTPHPSTLTSKSGTNKGCITGRNLPQKAFRVGLKPKNLIGIPWRVAFALQADGWYLRQDIIWHKPNPMPESVKDRCTKSHEYIFLLSKSRKYYYDYLAIKEPTVTNDKSVRNRDITKLNNTPGRTKMKGLKTNNYTTKNKRDVWTVSTKGYKGAHFAVFPPELIKPCVLAGCPENGKILDPFGGSGTTGMIANSFNRNATLIELNKDYVSIIEERVPDSKKKVTRGRKKG